MDKDDMKYKVKLVAEKDIPLSICRISPKGLLLIIGISLILILAVPYSGIFSTSSHHNDVASSKGQTFDNVLGLAKFKNTNGSAGVADPKCDVVKELERLDCYPEGIGDETTCLRRGCCWDDSSSSLSTSSSASSSEPDQKEYSGNPPSCFYPPGYPSYKMIEDPKNTTSGYVVKLRRNSASPYPMDIAILQMDVYLETDNRLHFKVCMILIWHLSLTCIFLNKCPPPPQINTPLHKICYDKNLILKYKPLDKQTSQFCVLVQECYHFHSEMLL